MNFNGKEIFTNEFMKTQLGTTTLLNYTKVQYDEGIFDTDYERISDKLGYEPAIDLDFEKFQYAVIYLT